MRIKLDIKIIEKYLSGITSDKFHRFRSWDNCHQAFLVKKATENHILQLAFYLASWGMYRGSSGLLQKNHLIHEVAVDILYLEKYQLLKCNMTNEVTREAIEGILEIKNELSKHYCSINFIRGVEKGKPISPTDTLISKILLGTFACVPAYDRYFIDGIKEKEFKYSGFSEPSLNELFNFIESNKYEIKKCQQLIKTKTKKHYPFMKILDMYFWQIGYDKEIKKRIRN